MPGFGGLRRGNRVVNIGFRVLGSIRGSASFRSP